MHIAHFVQRVPPALGGSESYFARLAAFLRSQGDTVQVWTTTAMDLNEFWQPAPRPPASTTLPHAYPPLTFPLRRYILKALSLIPHRSWQSLTLPCNPVCPRMWYDAGRFDGPLDAVHATAFPYTFPIACARRLARRRGVPFLLTPFLHLGDPTDPHDRTRRQYTQPVMRWLLREADHIFVQTEAESSAVEALGIPPQRITLQGLGVDADEVTGGNRVAARQAWGVTATDFVVGHLANASVEKGTVDLLRAAENSPVRVVLAGPSMPNFEQHWQRHPLGNVTRLGPISESQKRDFYAGMDAFGLPSRTDSFGLVLLEAWANAKPVVVYAAGGPGELVRSGVDGQVVPCGDVAGLRAILHRWAADAPLVRQLGEAGHRRVQQTFRWTDKLQRVRAVIQQLTAARLHNTTLDTTYGTTCNKLAGERNDSS